MALAIFLLPGAAAARSQYDFDSSGDLLAAASELPLWAKTLERHASQRAALNACALDESACRGRLRSFTRVMTRAPDLTPTEQIQLVNRYVNRVRYDDDRPQRINDDEGRRIGVQRSHWMTLYEFLTRGGDCEDYATAKYFMLRELGFEPEDMRVVVTYERRLRGYHAILAVRHENGEIWLLESDNLIKKRYHGGYRFIYAMNENAVWDHGN
jgi:predicted transglutaminase-like cysteine proteinase